MFEAPLAAVGFERRRVAVALFHKLQLEDILVRNLPPEETGAQASLAAFLGNALVGQAIEFLAIGEYGSGCRAKQMHDLAICAASDAGIPLQQVTLSELLSASAFPALRRRSQLRSMASSFWPVLNDPRTGHAGLDAAVLGLHVQLERLFNKYSESP